MFYRFAKWQGVAAVKGSVVLTLLLVADHAAT